MTVDVAAELAVRRSLSLACILADEAPLERLGELMLDDVTWSMGAGSWTGRSDVLAGLQVPRSNGLVGPGSGTRHLLSTVLVEPAASGVRSRASWMLVRSADQAVTVLMAGDYLDTWHLSDGEARLAARQVNRI